MLIAIFASSCTKSMRSYAEMKKDEKEAIDQLIVEEGFEILNKYPVDGVFGEKQFVKLDNDVYLNVVDSGNGNRPVTGKTTILMRCSGRFIFKLDSTGVFSTFPNLEEPIDFLYGYASITISQYSGYIGSNPWFYLSSGVESALEHVGENAIVKMIVPFESGSSYQNYNSLGAPLYYDKIKFTFY
jgi:hypothetical protein